ncbi:hypothetical protein [Mycoplasmopsis cynos]
MKIARKLAAEYIKKNNCSGFKLVINTGQTNRTSSFSYSYSYYSL